MLSILLMYMLFGAIAGVLAGLLGVGGGLILVPIIAYTLPLQGIDTPYNHLMALGTSLATIAFTSVSSFMSHHKNGAVRWDIVKSITPSILVGTFSGGYFVGFVPIVFLKVFFVFFLCYVGVQMLLNIRPSAGRQIPSFAGNSAAGLVIGLVSSFVGIGGGALSVPYLSWCNLPIHKCIGTSAVIGFPIAIAGTLGYIVSGLKVDVLPEYTIGFIFLPALMGIAMVSIFTAPLGARLAHSLPVAKLKKCFAFLLFGMGTQMLYKLLTS
ncbi:MAG: sulfite exporter TauE/SafE family protein [Candidatus Adiutrix sp.]